MHPLPQHVQSVTQNELELVVGKRLDFEFALELATDYVVVFGRNEQLLILLLILLRRPLPKLQVRLTSTEPNLRSSTNLLLNLPINLILITLLLQKVNPHLPPKHSSDLLLLTHLVTQPHPKIQLVTLETPPLLVEYQHSTLDVL